MKIVFGLMLIIFLCCQMCDNNNATYYRTPQHFYSTFDGKGTVKVLEIGNIGDIICHETYKVKVDFSDGSAAIKTVWFKEDQKWSINQIVYGR